MVSATAKIAFRRRGCDWQGAVATYRRFEALNGRYRIERIVKALDPALVGKWRTLRYDLATGKWELMQRFPARLCPSRKAAARRCQEHARRHRLASAGTADL